jgi:hypothetical protein
MFFVFDKMLASMNEVFKVQETSASKFLFVLGFLKVQEAPGLETARCEAGRICDVC